MVALSVLSKLLVLVLSLLSLDVVSSLPRLLLLSSLTSSDVSTSFSSSPRHGVHTPCLLPTLPPFLSTYISLPPDSSMRSMLEKRYGAQNLQRMARQAIEDMGNKKWFEERSRVCGGCGVRVEKSHGCNHVSTKRPREGGEARLELTLTSSYPSSIDFLR